MSNISKAQKNLKKKLSLDDYMQIEEQEQGANGQVQVAETTTDKNSTFGAEKKAEQTTASSKIKATYYLTEDDHSALTHVYIKRLQNKQKTDRSALISEAIRLLYKKEMA